MMRKLATFRTMNVYIWNQVEQCSDNYHREGGVVVFANSMAEARRLANEQPGCAIKDTENPDEVRECGNGEKKVYIMPNAGCC